MNNPSDQQLIDGCLAGETAAFGLLVERYQHRLYGSLVQVTGSVDQAHDIAQDTFLHAFEKLSTFRGQSQFYSWLYRIALNAAVSARRKTRRVTASLDVQRELTGVEPADEAERASPSVALEISERRQLVQKALQELSPEFRTVLVLKEMDDLKYEEIAEIVNIPVGTVRSRIHRARMELRAKLQCRLQPDVR